MCIAYVRRLFKNAARKSDKMLEPYEWKRSSTVLREERGSNAPDLLDYWILILSEIWKGTGWGTIIYTAAITGIDPTLYEAAKMDGCTRSGCIFRITFPMILPVCTVMFIMQLSNIMNAGFDAVYNLYNRNVFETADILDTYVYRLFTESSGGNGYALSTAVNLFKSAINFCFLIAGNIITKKINGYSMFTID